MKKNVKLTLAVVMVVAAVLGGMKTYDAYAPVSQSDLLLSENVEALSDGWGSEIATAIYRYVLDTNYDSNAALKGSPCFTKRTNNVTYSQGGQASGPTGKGFGSISGNSSVSYSSTSEIAGYQYLCEYEFFSMCDRRQQKLC
jgi:hypothetical protein